MLNITKGRIDRAVKTVIYGSEGIGKSTFASHYPDPVFIDTEGGTAQMDIRRIEKPATWNELIADIEEVAKTLVIDTADWAEQLCVAHVCEKYKQNSIESFGYGKGYTYLAEEWARFLAACDKVIAAGIHVVIVAHAKQRKQELPDEAGAFDRWEMKLTKQVAPLLKEWADLLLFLNYRTYVVTTETNSKKAQGGKRVMFTTHHPCWDAKNRHGLPDELDLDFKNIAHIYKTGTAKAPVAEDNTAAIDQLNEKLVSAPFTGDDLLAFVKSKGHHKDAAALSDIPAKFITGWILKYWDQITEALANSQSDK